MSTDIANVIFMNFPLVQGNYPNVPVCLSANQLLTLNELDLLNALFVHCPLMVQSRFH